MNLQVIVSQVKAGYTVTLRGPSGVDLGRSRPDTNLGVALQNALQKAADNGGECIRLGNRLVDA